MNDNAFRYKVDYITEPESIKGTIIFTEHKDGHWVTSADYDAMKKERDEAISLANPALEAVTDILKQNEEMQIALTEVFEVVAKVEAKFAEIENESAS